MRNEVQETARCRVLFEMLTRDSKHWKDAFKAEFVLASKEIDEPLDIEAVRGIALELTNAIQYFHGAAAVINLSTKEVLPYRGASAAYWSFDGYVLTVGSTGYAC